MGCILTSLLHRFLQRVLFKVLFHSSPFISPNIFSGEGMPDLLFHLAYLPQKRLADRLALCAELECTVLEVKVIEGYGCTIDVVLTQGVLREGDTIVLAGLEGPIVTTIRSLLMPAPLKEMRVKNAYNTFPVVEAAQGLKIAARDLENAVAGLPIAVAYNKDEIPVLMEEASARFKSSLKSIALANSGLAIQASTLGSLEAMMDFLKGEKVPVAYIGIGPVHKRDVMKAAIQLDKDKKYGVMLAFDVPVDRDAQALADERGLRIFAANIIYQLFDQFKAHTEELKRQLREQFKNVAVFPCRLRILPDCIFNARDPIVVGVSVEEGIVKRGTPLVVVKEDRDPRIMEIGVVESLEVNHETVEQATRGQEVCIKVS